MRRILVFTFVTLVMPLYAFERQPNADYRARREHLASKLNGGVAVVFAGTEGEGQNNLHGFRQDDDFYYLTGWREPGAGLIVAPAEGQRPYTEILFLPAHNVSQERWTGPKLGPESPDAKSITGFDRVEVLDHLRDELVRILPSPAAMVYTDITTHGTTSSTTPIAWLQRANAFPNYAAMKPSADAIAPLRLIKDAGEIALLRHATDATLEAHRAAMRAARPGMSEN